jgi:hypothetical protein
VRHFGSDSMGSILLNTRPIALFRVFL